MYVCVFVSADSESDQIPLDTGDSSDETLLNSIDKLSDACFMRSVLSMSCSLELLGFLWCASDSVAECRICNREVAGSNLSLGYFAPRSTQPSIPPGSVNEYQLWLGRQRQVWLIPIVDERVGVQVKL